VTARLRDAWRGIEWRDAALYGGAFALPFAAYLLTLGPTAMGDDSAELTVAAYVLGVPHPTGYPLYMLLGKAWQLLVPIGSIAYRMNLLSAVCAAATCAAVAWVCRLLGCRRSAALLGALTAGSFRIFWQQSNVAEVYALSALFVALILGAFLVWHRCRSERSLIALAFICGLAFTHHHVSLCFSVVFLGIAVMLQRPVRAGWILKGLAALALPQALHLYLPVRAAANPPLNWENATTWPAFWDHVTGAPWLARYGFTRRGEELAAFLGGVLRLLRGDMTLFGLALGVAGLAALTRRRALFSGGALVAFGIVAASGSMSPLYRTTSGHEALIPCLLILALWIAVGADWAAAHMSRALAWSARWALPLLAVGLPARAAAFNWSHADVSRDWRAYDYAQLVLAEADPRAVVVLHGYTAHMASLYLQVVEGRRPDVDLVSVDFSGTRWFPPTVRDGSIAQALVEAQSLRDAGAAEDWTSLLARALLSRLEGRPLHCNVDINQALLPPGWGVLIVDPLRKVVAEPSPPLVRDTGKPAGTLPEGIAALGVTPSPPRAKRGEVVRLTWHWRLAQPVEAPAVVRLVITSQDRLRGAALRLEPTPDVGFSARRPFGCAVLPLPPTPAPQALAQDMYLVAPRTLRPGLYTIHAALETAAGTWPPIPAGEIEITP